MFAYNVVIFTSNEYPRNEIFSFSVGMDLDLRLILRIFKNSSRVMNLLRLNILCTFESSFNKLTDFVVEKCLEKEALNNAARLPFNVEYILNCHSKFNT